MNRWKTAFWSLLAVWLLTAALGAYVILDQGVSLTYQHDGYAATEADLRTLARALNANDLTADGVCRAARAEKQDPLRTTRGTVELRRISLQFRKGRRLPTVEQQW